MRTLLTVITTVFFSCATWAYPLDGYNYTGIKRLEGYRLVQKKKIRGNFVPRGSRMKMRNVRLRLHNNNFELPKTDPVFTKKIVDLLGEDKDKYGIAILDLSRLDKIAYAEYNANRHITPASVGKVAVVTAIFNELAKHYPGDTGSRERILRTATVTADRFIKRDTHQVPFWEKGQKEVSYRELRIGDKASLWTFMDWMLSASSNAAASMVVKNAILLNHFGKRYPVDDKKKSLTQIFQRSMTEGLKKSGINTEKFRQGSFFTRGGKNAVPGFGSRATARELMRYLLYLEQGRIIDVFSSREIKRLLYMTQGRIRYASHAVLDKSALYFKSGSIYRCYTDKKKPCKKYQGTKLNILNSIAIIETPARKRPKLFYMVVVTSNILNKHSPTEHHNLALKVHRLIQQRYRDNR